MNLGMPSRAHVRHVRVPRLPRCMPCIRSSSVPRHFVLYCNVMYCIVLYILYSRHAASRLLSGASPDDQHGFFRGVHVLVGLEELAAEIRVYRHLAYPGRQSSWLPASAGSCILTQRACCHGAVAGLVQVPGVSASANSAARIRTCNLP